MATVNLGEALQNFMHQSKLRNGLRAAQIEEIWEQLMGTTIAKYTEQIKIIGDKLYITSHHAALKNELAFQKELIVERVNEAMGETIVKDVVIQ